MVDREEIVAQLLAECDEDHVGLWELVNAVQLDLGIRDPATVRAATLDLVRSLLEHPRMEIGVPTPDGRHFAAWDVSSDEAVEAIRQQWEALGRDPDIGEIAWFSMGNPTQGPSLGASPRTT
jgi:hypothetical protein